MSTVPQKLAKLLVLLCVSLGVFAFGLYLQTAPKAGFQVDERVEGVGELGKRDQLEIRAQSFGPGKLRGQVHLTLNGHARKNIGDLTVARFHFRPQDTVAQSFAVGKFIALRRDLSSIPSERLARFVGDETFDFGVRPEAVSPFPFALPFPFSNFTAHFVIMGVEAFPKSQTNEAFTGDIAIQVALPSKFQVSNQRFRAEKASTNSGIAYIYSCSVTYQLWYVLAVMVFILSAWLFALYAHLSKIHFGIELIAGVVYAGTIRSFVVGAEGVEPFVDVLVLAPFLLFLFLKFRKETTNAIPAPSSGNLLFQRKFSIRDRIQRVRNRTIANRSRNRFRRGTS